MSKFITLGDIYSCSGKRMAFDTETDGLSWAHNKIIGVSIHCPDAEVFGYIPTLTDGERKQVKKAFNLLDRTTVMIAHNWKFDGHFLDLPPRKFTTILDTTVLVHLIDSRYRKNLGNVEQVFLGTTSKRDHVTQAPARKKIWMWPLEVVADYGYNDALVTYQLAEERLVKEVTDLGLWDLFQKDMEYLKDIWDIERRGILMDPEYLEKAMVIQTVTIEDLEQQLYDSCGYTFNWRSHQQLSKAIYDNLGIPKPKNPFAGADGIDRSRFADAGLYKSTCTSSFLLTEKINHPLGTLISALRESYRLRKTMEKYLEQMDSDEIIHANFNLTGTRTGRLSSSKPNLQNVPAHVRGRFTQSIYTGDTYRSEEYNLRKAFKAREGYKFLSIDWKQMEMRMFGILSQDPFMLKSLAAGKDVHADIADKVWNSRDEVHREWSKTISFGLIYGMTIGSLMFKLNMTKNQAAIVCDQYWAEFPRIKPWMDEVIDRCKKFGYIRYWSGRIWREENPIDMYKGCNALIQGGCADLLSVAELRVAKTLRLKSFDTGVINLVHDEIISEVPIEHVVEVEEEQARLMRVEDLFGIPFITDSKVGDDYGDLYKFEDVKDNLDWENEKEEEEEYTEELAETL